MDEVFYAEKLWLHVNIFSETQFFTSNKSCLYSIWYWNLVTACSAWLSCIPSSKLLNFDEIGIFKEALVRQVHVKDNL